MDINGFFARKNLGDSSVASPMGKALFVAGVVLGAMAGKNEEVEKRVYALLHWGDVTLASDLKRALSEVPLLAGQHFEPGEAQRFLDAMVYSTDIMIVEGLPGKLSVDESFALSMGYVGASRFFAEIAGGE